MRRAIGLLSLLLLVAAGAPPSAGAALFFLFNPTSAKPGDRVAIRTGGTPLRFKATQRIRPFQQPVRLFLVANGVAPNVNSSPDPRLHPIGSLVPDKNGRGVMTFRVPQLDPDAYAVAGVCPGCARYSNGRTFFVLHVDDAIVPQFRPFMLLRVRAANSVAGPLERLLELRR